MASRYLTISNSMFLSTKRLTCSRKFLIQGDFVLTASRQDIDVSCPWNKSLLSAIPAAFLSAAQQFNRGPMRYAWPCLLQQRPLTNDLFMDLEKRTLQLLSQYPILRSCAEDRCAKPDELRLVPKSYRDGDGKFLLSCDALNHKYLSPCYAEADSLTLVRLGVRQQSAEEFLSDLDTLLQQHPVELWQRPAKWHSHLSSTLLSMIRRRPECRRGVLAMKLVPLRSGKWVPFSQERLVLAEERRHGKQA